MPNLLARKPLNLLVEEARQTGEHSLKRTLGVFQLTALGVGAVIGAGIFVMAGLGAHYAGPGLMLSFVLSGLGCAFAGLCYAEFAAMIPLAGSAYTYAYATLGEIFAWIIGWDLTLEYAMGASTVSSGWSNHFIELLDIFHLKMPLWLAYDHWTALRTAQATIARQMAQASDASLVPGTQAFLEKVAAITAAGSPELIRRAHELLNAPHLFGMEIGFNLPAFLIALAITAILAIGIKESAQFNAVIVTIKVSVVLFVIGLGVSYISKSNWGSDWHTFAPMGFSGIGAGAAYIFFAYIGFDAVSTTAQEAKNPQRDLPIGIIASLLICTVLYIAVAAVLTGMVPWRDVNIEAPIARAFIDRGLTGASHVITLGALAGLTSVMLVMLLGQTRVLYSMANDGLLPKRFFAAIHPRFRTPWKNTILVGTLAAVVGSLTPIDDIGKMVNIGTLLAFVIVCIAIMALRHTDPAQPRPFRTPWVPLVPILGILFNGYMMYKLGWVNWARLIGWLFIGLIVYFTYGQKHSRVQAALKATVARVLLLTVIAACVLPTAFAQPPQGAAQLAEARKALEEEIESVAIVERKVMVPMRDGKRMAADIYRPKDTSKKYPIIFVRTPYNFNYWDVRNGVPADMKAPLEAVKHGYAFVEMNERGHFFSEGNYDILGPPLTDGYDAITWMSSLPWSNGKVGTIGCSSTAEWQLGVAAQGNPALAAMIPQGFGAGVGRVGPYYEQGNWFRGGAVQMLFIAWLYGEQNTVRPMFPPGTSQEDLARAAKAFDLAQQLPPVDWSKALQHLPEMDIIKSVDGPHGIFADREEVSTGGAMIKRTPNDPAWYRGGLWHDDKTINVPGFWFMSWYDVSVGPNLAAYNYVRKTAKPEIANEQYAVIAPTLHCGYKRATEHTVVGEREMGDARLDYDALTYGWFDHFLKGEDNHFLEKTPRVRYFTMGLNKWQTADTWPPAGAQPMTLYLASAGKANSLYGDGALADAAPDADAADGFVYDPTNPVPSYGGNVCCTGNAVTGGAFDQRKMEARADILVYTTEPLKEGIEVSGPMEATLYVSSDVKDTDFTVKAIDVYPDGTAYNLDETIQRARYRDGYEKPPVWMEPGQVYKVGLQPMTTSNYFPVGHRIRIEVSSSNFPRFDRNFNTGGNTYDEVKGVVAHNVVHHSKEHPSQITITVVKRPVAAGAGG